MGMILWEIGMGYCDVELHCQSLCGYWELVRPVGRCVIPTRKKLGHRGNKV